MKYSDDELRASLEQAWDELCDVLNGVASLPVEVWREEGRKAMAAFNHEDGSVPPRHKQIVRHWFSGEIWVDGRGWVLGS